MLITGCDIEPINLDSCPRYQSGRTVGIIQRGVRHLLSVEHAAVSPVCRRPLRGDLARAADDWDVHV